MHGNHLTTRRTVQFTLLESRHRVDKSITIKQLSGMGWENSTCRDSNPSPNLLSVSGPFVLRAMNYSKYNSYHLLSTYKVLGPVLGDLSMLFNSHSTL